MTIPREQADDFIDSYCMLLHYVGVAHGIIPEDMSMPAFRKGGAELLVKCRYALFEDLTILEEFAEDAREVGPEFYYPTLRAVGRMRPIKGLVLRDTEDHTIVFEPESAVFHHVKSLTEPLAGKLGQYRHAMMVLMTYEGTVIHDGLVAQAPDAPLTTAEQEAIEAKYAEALAHGRIAKAWGPGGGSMQVDDLSKDALRVSIMNATMLHPEFAATFVKLTTVSPDEGTFLELCLDTVLLLRGKPYAELLKLFETTTPPEHDLILFTLDRIEGDVKALLRKRNKSFRTGTSRQGDKRRTAPSSLAKPITLAERLHALTPFTVTGTRELTQVMREEGLPITMKSKLTVTKVEDGPDEIGIACFLDGISADELVVAPLTYLVLPGSLPLFKEASNYQRRSLKRILG